MRFGLARLAATLASPERPTTIAALGQSLAKILTAPRKLQAEHVETFSKYLQGKPGSPRYTRWRTALKLGKSPEVEQQDVWLSCDSLKSSVGSLTENYFEDPVTLAEILGLLQPKTNILMSRGRLSLLKADYRSFSPFPMDMTQSLYLGLWLLKADCDWIWAFLRVLQADGIDEITVSNRVVVLLHTIEVLLNSREIRSPTPQYAMTRQRLLDLRKITERNNKEGLNLGQPWSWFLIPRLELLVDAGLLNKRKPHDLTGYTLTEPALAMQRHAIESAQGQALHTNYFGCHFQARTVNPSPQWDEVYPLLFRIRPALEMKTGHCLIYEATAATCVLRAVETEGAIWEMSAIRALLKSVSNGEMAEVTLSIDKYGAPYSFKLRKAL